MPVPLMNEERAFAASSTKRLSLVSFNGDIAYEPHDDEHITITSTIRAATPSRALAERIGSRVAVSFELKEGELRVAGRERPGWALFGHAQVDFVVRVPRDWNGTIALTTSNGSIRASGMRGDGTLYAENGGITVSESGGSLLAHTSNGPVEVVSFDGEMQVDTSNDTIRIAAARLRGHGSMKTSNGAIVLEEARMMNDAHYDVSTSNGNVTVTLLEPDVTLDVRTSNGKIQLPGGATTADIEDGRVLARMGDGSARLNIRTSHGTVRVSVGQNKISG